ncbi:Mitogen-activated protein kinase kinase kinase 4 [Nymphon striatum]|nr:Mitogen-activated protein kinase kinase kinase 4 [Nymphon striatum]
MLVNNSRVEGKTSTPVKIPVETVLTNNEGGYFGLCESLDSPKSSFDAELFDSMAASKFLKEYVNFNDEPQRTDFSFRRYQMSNKCILNTGTRSSKRQKEKNATYRRSQNQQEYQQRKHTLNQQKKYSEFSALNRNSHNESDSDDSEKKNKKSINRRKRYDERNRAFDRQFKEVSLNLDPTEFLSNTHSTDISPASNMSEKVVDVSDEFKSINSKCVVGSPTRRSTLDSGSDQEMSLPYCSGNYVPDSISGSDLSNGRVDFHNSISILLKAGSKEKSDRTWRQALEICNATNIRRKKILGSIMNQWDIKKLELNVMNKEVFLAVISYKFDPGMESKCCELPSTLAALNLTNKFSGCSISCERFIAIELQAYDEIYNLLETVYEAEKLYPSTKALSEDQSLYSNEDFKAKYRTLCLWINIVSEIKSLLALLSNLFQIEIKWISEFNRKHGESGYGSSFRLRNDSGIYTSNTTTPSPSIHPHCCPDSSFAACAASGDSEGSETQESDESEFSSKNNSIYHAYVDKMLRQKGGLRKMMFQLRKLLTSTLMKVGAALQPFVPVNTYASVAAKTTPVDPWCDNPGNLTDFSSKFSEMEFLNLNPNINDDLKRYGTNSKYFQEMSLPSFLPYYFYLIKIPIGIMQECLISEIQEVIRAGVIMRNMYIEMIKVVYSLISADNIEISKLNVQATASEYVDVELQTFDENMRKILQVYLSYIQRQMQLTQCVSDPTVCKFCLESDWSFMKSYSGQIRGGKALAATQFCFYTKDMLDYISDVLERSIDEANTKLCDSIITETETDVTRCRQNILSACREYKQVLHLVREKCRVMAFAKMLRKDLEIAAEYQLNNNSLECKLNFLDLLYQTNHVRVVAPHSKGYLMFIPGVIQDDKKLLWQLMQTISGHSTENKSQDMSLLTNSNGYLLIMHYDDEYDHLLSWKGTAIIMEANAENTIILSHVELKGLLVVVTHSSQLCAQRSKFKGLVGDAVSLSKSHTSCNQAVAEALYEVKVQALDLRVKIASAIQEIQNRFQLFAVNCLDQSEISNIKELCKQILVQAYSFGFDFHRDLVWLVTNNTRELSFGLFCFARQWIKFVFSWIQRGRGIKPKWAGHGLDFLNLITNPRFTSYLEDNEFMEIESFSSLIIFKRFLCIDPLAAPQKKKSDDVKSDDLDGQSPLEIILSPKTSWSNVMEELKNEINQTVVHVIGSQSTSPSITPSPSSASFSTFNYRWSSADIDGLMNHSYSFQDSPNFYSRTTSMISSQSEPACITNSPEHKVDGRIGIRPVDRVRKAISLVEENRERNLVKQNKIGHICDISSHSKMKLTARKVNFSWQRGKKIGEGRFGKVYTVVNNNTGELIAMKEIMLPPGDHKVIKEVTDEIYIFERIHHKHLLRYYGVEVHREEMYIFMELCNEGTLEYACELGLVETTIRKYTRQLLLAISVLHEQKIVHRDIKSANIFLTSDGNLKLGDFGCCIRLKSNATMPGELSAFVGTPAYMAPEVITQSGNKGHGRAADIWSLGCVVVEMFTGKRPWHELENSQQIMFKVGMGGTPDIPENAGEEGEDFICQCLVHDPSERATASELLTHTFTKYLVSYTFRKF